MVVNGGDLENATTGDYVMHFLTFGFKVFTQHFFPIWVQCVKKYQLSPYFLDLPFLVWYILSGEKDSFDNHWKTLEFQFKEKKNQWHLPLQKKFKWLQSFSVDICSDSAAGHGGWLALLRCVPPHDRSPCHRGRWPCKHLWLSCRTQTWG